MDLSKLALLKTETLLAMQETIKTVLAARLDTTLRPGRRATFEYNGTIRTVTVERVNPKTATCIETGSSVQPGKSWRVGHSLLKVEPTERPSPKTPALRTPHRPASYAGDAW